MFLNKYFLDNSHGKMACPSLCSITTQFKPIAVYFTGYMWQIIHRTFIRELAFVFYLIYYFDLFYYML